jgi:hypothetical protein
LVTPIIRGVAVDHPDEKRSSMLRSLPTPLEAFGQAGGGRSATKPGQPVRVARLT